MPIFRANRPSPFTRTPPSGRQGFRLGAGVGFALGALLGGALGVGLGLAWTALFETSCLEGDCRLTVFFAFMPIGALIGGGLGAIALTYRARSRAQAPSSM